MTIDFKRLSSLSGVNYKEPVKHKVVKKKKKKKVSLMETNEYKEGVKAAVLLLLETSEKDGQITFKTRKKERIVINDKEYSSKNIKGIVTVIIIADDIKDTGFSLQEIAYELKINKEFYKKEIDILEVIDGKNEEIDEFYVNIKGDNVVLKIYYSSEKEIDENIKS